MRSYISSIVHFHFEAKKRRNFEFYCAGLVKDGRNLIFYIQLHGQRLYSIGVTIDRKH